MFRAKKITQRIEQTMAARASNDGGGLQVLKAEAEADGKKVVKLGAAAPPALSSKKNKQR